MNNFTDYKIVIDILAIVISIFALIISIKANIYSTYHDKAIFIPLFKPMFLPEIRKRSERNIRTYINVNTEKYLCTDYEIVSQTKIGGISSAIFFDMYPTDSRLGLQRKHPIGTLQKNRFRTFAYNAKYYFEFSHPWKPYITIDGENNEAGKPQQSLNRYLKLIQFIDFCGNIEYAYASFSLLLSEYKYDDEDWWKDCKNSDSNWNYYAVNDFNIYLSTDRYINYYRVFDFNKSLDDIKKEQTGFTNPNSSGKGVIYINGALQQHEMKAFNNFIKYTQSEWIVVTTSTYYKIPGTLIEQFITKSILLFFNLRYYRHLMAV
jgi:hypothetical protein